MKALVFGHRLGIARSLERKGIPYVLWSTKEVKNKLLAEQIVIGPYPESPLTLCEKIEKFADITHIIAGVENSVITASKARAWLDLRRNPHSVILICTDKLKMKKFLANKGIPTTRFVPSLNKGVEEIVEKLGLPVVCKEKLSSGGRGVEFLRTKDEISDRLGKENLYFEKAIVGTEGSIESFICDRKILFTSTTEYYKHGLCNKVPARYTEEIKNKIKELNQNVISAMSIKWGMTHLEYYITEDEILFGEVALRPPGGYLMDTLALCYEENFWDKFVEIETGSKTVQFNNLKNFSSSIIIYPKEGTIKTIEGLDKIEKLSSLKHMKINLKVGQKILQREGVGQDFGHVFLSNSSESGLDQDVDRFYSELVIENE